MHNPADNRPLDAEADVSQALRDDLAALFGPDVAVPPAVDAAVMARARGHLGRRRWRGPALRWAAAAAAAAAAAVFVLVMPALTSREAPEASRPAPMVAKAAPGLRDDINGDGQVDVLDAFALARSVENKQKLAAAWDLNRDGVVDRKDADAVAMAAVSLKRGTVQ